MRGKGHMVFQFFPAHGDHPRVCGEKHRTHCAGLCCGGSPPRMRGKAGAHTNAHDQRGITPAYAGKSGFVCRFNCAFWDHPRVCGEKVLRIHRHRNSVGSPPRMRGKVACTCGHTDALRITPAYAGKSASFMIAFEYVWDHPRVCGEKFRYPAIPGLDKGSPPRMRGKG